MCFHSSEVMQKYLKCPFIVNNVIFLMDHKCQERPHLSFLIHEYNESDIFNHFISRGQRSPQLSSRDLISFSSAIRGFWGKVLSSPHRSEATACQANVPLEKPCGAQKGRIGPHSFLPNQRAPPRREINTTILTSADFVCPETNETEQDATHDVEIRCLFFLIVCLWSFLRIRCADFNTW